jgi:hypothetical protein
MSVAKRSQAGGLALLWLSLIVPSVHAGGGSGPGWSPDPSSNLLIAGRSGEEAQARILPISDGGFYVSWFDNTDGGYDVRLQRLDVNGRALWAQNGILVADRSFSWTTDYGFAVDTDGHAVLSFQCCEQDGPDERLVVARVTPEGELAWPAPGVSITTAGNTAAVSRLTATDDGNTVVAWMNGVGEGRAQKLAPDGTPVWAAGGVVIAGPGSASRFIADVQPGINGDAIVSWSNQPTFLTRVLYAQKLASADGSARWGTGVRVSDSGNLQAGNFPPFIPDGQGGAVFAYYDNTGVTFDVRVQHLDGDGVRRFGNDGVIATLDTSRNHVAPAGTFDAATGDTYVAWIDDWTSNMQAWHALRVQRIDANGARQWGDHGIEMVAPAIATTGENALSMPVVLVAPEGVVVAWATGNPAVTSHPIRAQYLDRDGVALWPEPVAIKTSPTLSARLTGATSTAGYMAFVWSDSPDNNASGNDVKGQNLHYDGSLGDVLFADGFEAAD